jgi:hypothetical protein
VFYRTVKCVVRGYYYPPVVKTTSPKRLNRSNFMNHLNTDSTYIDNCSNCHQTCLQTAMTHCLNMGGKHLEPEHFRLMLDCAKICETSVYFQLSDSKYSKDICKVCAEICTACADSCEEVGGMEDCVSACRNCAESCSAMASNTH